MPILQGLETWSHSVEMASFWAGPGSLFHSARLPPPHGALDALHSILLASDLSLRVLPQLGLSSI